jgi:hypothetical protein
MAKPPSDWDFDFDPSIGTLPVDAKQSATLTLEIPVGDPGDLSNGTMITATLECELPCRNEGMDGEGIDTFIALPTFLPFVVSSPHQTCWESEPNDRCSQADGPLRPAAEYYGYTNDNRDLWEVFVPESKLRVDLSVVPEAGVQLWLVDADCQDVEYCRDITPEDGYWLDCIVPSGSYFVDVWVANPISSYPPYILEVTFPE